MMMGLLNSFRTLFRRNHVLAEFWSATVAISWSVWNIWDSSDLASVPAYQFVVSIAGEPALETAGLSVGALQLGFLLRGSDWTRGICAFLACWFYCLFVIGFLLAPVSPPGVVFVVGWAGVNVFAIIRLTQGLR